MNINKIKSQINNLAKEYNLNYKSEWFEFLWVSKREEILKEYTGTCPDPIYLKYGKTSSERIKNIDMFVNSIDFQKCIKRYGGQVASKDCLNINEMKFKRITNKIIRKELLNLNNKIKKKCRKNDYLALITKTKIKKELNWIYKNCIRHEWIHILLENNKIYFQSLSNKYWPYDEGINQYFGAFLDNNLTKLEKFRDMEAYPLEKKSWDYAIKFRKLLRNNNSPSERKETILKLIKTLKFRQEMQGENHKF